MLTREALRRGSDPARVALPATSELDDVLTDHLAPLGPDWGWFEPARRSGCNQWAVNWVSVQT